MNIKMLALHFLKNLTVISFIMAYPLTVWQTKIKRRFNMNGKIENQYFNNLFIEMVVYRRLSNVNTEKDDYKVKKTCFCNIRNITAITKSNILINEQYSH